MSTHLESTGPLSRYMSCCFTGVLLSKKNFLLTMRIPFFLGDRKSIVPMVIGVNLQIRHLLQMVIM